MAVQQQSKADEKCSTPHLREGVIKEVFIKALNKLVTDKGPALDMMDHLKAKIDDTATLEGKLEKEYREAQAEKVKLQDELTERRRRSLMIKRFIDEVSGFDEAFTEFSENL